MAETYDDLMAQYEVTAGTVDQWCENALRQCDNGEDMTEFDVAKLKEIAAEYTNNVNKLLVHFGMPPYEPK